MTQDQIYQNIAQRTGGDIYLGVVGPVRSGKSTFIKRFAELMLLPRIKNEARRARAHDELPQSAAGRTIMTTEPKFIPEKAVKLELSGGGSFKARLIDCVGYMVDGALGHEENEAPRLVKSPWFDHEVPFDLAAETGTRCVIREHATVGLVVTTDGSVADLPREAYLDAERRIIAELDGIGKPYIILLNCAEPDSDDAQRLAAELAETYGHAVLPLELHDDDRRDPRQAAANAFVRVPDPRDRRADARLGHDARKRALAAKRGLHVHAGFCCLGAPDGRPCRQAPSAGV